MRIWMYDYLYSFYYEYNKGKLAERFSAICAVVATQVLHIFFLLFLVQKVFKINLLKQHNVPYEIGKMYLLLSISGLFAINIFVYWKYDHMTFNERNNVTGKFKIRDIFYQSLIFLFPLLIILVSGRFFQE